MAKAKSIEAVQNHVLGQFKRDIRAESYRDWLNITEKAILKGREDHLKRESSPQLNKPRISFYDPNNPLNGSLSWTKEQWTEYNKSQKSVTSK